MHDPADSARRDWVSFDHGGDTYLFDVTFLSSNWRCIFGEGCRGVHEEDTTELGHGCCSHGAHFADAADRKRVARHASALSSEQWQLLESAEELGGPFVKEDGSWKTRVVDGACVFLNRNDHPGGAGCALHTAALDDGVSFLERKPEVCWQLPLRLSHHTDESEHTTWTLREWKRRDWGEGGADFHWWCTESEEAYVSQQSVAVTMKDEIVALVGEDVYERLVEELDRFDRGTPVPWPVSVA